MRTRWDQCFRSRVTCRDVARSTRNIRRNAVPVDSWRKVDGVHGRHLHRNSSREDWCSARVAPERLVRPFKSSGSRKKSARAAGVHEQGFKMLGTPMEHPDFATTHLDRMTTEHRMFLRRIPSVPDFPMWLGAFVTLCNSMNIIPFEDVAT